MSDQSKNPLHVRIKRSRHDKENPFAQISKKMLRDKELSLSAKGLLCFFLTLTDSWEIQPKQIAYALGETEHKIYKAIKELRKIGYCERTCHRDPEGKITGWTYEVSEEKIYIYDSESDFEPDCGLPDLDNPDLEKCHIRETESKEPMSKRDTYKDNVLREGGNVDNSKPQKHESPKKKTVPSSIDKGKTLDASRRWKLTEDQRDTFNFLDSANIDTTEGNIAYWSKTYSLERIIEVYEEAKAAKPDSMGAYMMKLLKSNANVLKGHAAANKEFAEEFKQNNSWHQLKILKKYCSYPVGKTSQDLDYNMQPMDFANMIINAYNRR